MHFLNQFAMKFRNVFSASCEEIIRGFYEFMEGLVGYHTKLEAVRVLFLWHRH